MTPEERHSLKTEIAWLRMERDVDCDQLTTLRRIQAETKGAIGEIVGRSRAIDAQIAKLGAALGPAPIKPRDARLGKTLAEAERAFPAVNRGAA